MTPEYTARANLEIEHGCLRHYHHATYLAFHPNTFQFLKGPDHDQ